MANYYVFCCLVLRGECEKLIKIFFFFALKEKEKKKKKKKKKKIEIKKKKKLSRKAVFS